MTTYAYHRLDGDNVECARCGCVAPLAPFDISDLPRKFAAQKAGEPTDELICEVCACTHCGTVLGSTANSQRELDPIARMIAQATNLVLDKVLKRRPPE